MSDEKTQAETAMAVMTLKMNMPAMLELQRLQAKLIRERYLYLVREGFTDEQALRLCGEVKL